MGAKGSKPGQRAQPAEAVAGPCSEWAATEFAAKAAQAKLGKDYDRLKSLLKEVSENNYKLREQWQVPRTVPVTHKECMSHECKFGKPAEVSFSTMSTADALLHFGRQRNHVVCGLNFANGENVGGGYKNGSTAQEEDLCRRIPSLYPSLYNGAKEGLYPFGPCTCSSADNPEKYADVLYTAHLIVARQGDEDGFAFLPKSQQLNVSLVAAAAPNINFKKEVSNPDLMYKAIQTIFLAPKLIQPEVTTLVLGAWGCGAFGGDPNEICRLFVQALVRDNLGQLYKHVHFAIPRTSPTDKNYDTFKGHLKTHYKKLREI